VGLRRRCARRLRYRGKCRALAPATPATVYPLIKLPTAARGLGNHMAEYTLNVPSTIALPARFSVTLEPAVGLLRNLNKQGYHADPSPRSHAPSSVCAQSSAGFQRHSKPKPKRCRGNCGRSLLTLAEAPVLASQIR